jgi:hypothetical protein
MVTSRISEGNRAMEMRTRGWGSEKDVMPSLDQPLSD